MVIGSHNSWSYRRALRWWLRPFQFVARCQRVDIRRQYVDYGVRCFDLRIRFDDDGRLQVAHGPMVYDISREELDADLAWIDSHGDCYVRVIHEARTVRQHSEVSVKGFVLWCREAMAKYQGIEFWCGRNLCDWTYDYSFGYPEPVCEERYSSVCPPKWLDDWWPWLYARLNNKWNIKEVQSMEPQPDILLIDYVNIR